MIAVVEPATGQVMAEVPRAGAQDVDAAVARAKAAFGAWRDMAPPDRAAMLRRLADRLEESLEELARLEARNAGKPISDSRGEMGMVVRRSGRGPWPGAGRRGLLVCADCARPGRER